VFIESLARAHILALHGLETKPDQVGGQFFLIGDANAKYVELLQTVWSKFGFSGRLPHRPLLSAGLEWFAVLADHFTHGWTSNIIANFFSPTSVRISKSPCTYGPCTKAQTLLGWRPCPLEEGLNKACAAAK